MAGAESLLGLVTQGAAGLLTQGGGSTRGCKFIINFLERKLEVTRSDYYWGRVLVGAASY